jgi:hypothetical protein
MITRKKRRKNNNKQVMKVELKAGRTGAAQGMREGGKGKIEKNRR